MSRVPSYLRLSRKEFKKRIEISFEMLRSCRLCPRECGINRVIGEKGFCKVAYLPMVSSYGPHFGEEDVLVGVGGSGTIFFTGCNLGCVYCQNYDISQNMEGEEVPFESLAKMMVYLQNIGCHNINFVTPTHQVPQILRALEIAIDMGLSIPLVYNTGGYDSVETLKLLDGIFDIYMPDIKYSNEEFAKKYSLVDNYFYYARLAVKEMYRQVGDLKVDENGIAYRGLIVRHLVLPNNIAGSYEVLKFISEEISKNTFVNIMRQYYPTYRAYKFPELSRRITISEYYDVLNIAKELGLLRVITQ